MLKSLKQSIHFMQQSTGVQEVKLKMLSQLAVVIPFSDPGSDLFGLFNSFDQVLLLQSELTVFSTFVYLTKSF